MILPLSLPLFKQERQLKINLILLNLNQFKFPIGVTKEIKKKVGPLG